MVLRRIGGKISTCNDLFRKKELKKHNMKKSLIIGILSLAATAATSFGQGFVQLDNYNFTGGLVQYGANVPLNGVGGALASANTSIAQSGWTVGLYWALGTPAVSDPSGPGIPDAALTLAAGNDANGATVTDMWASTQQAGQFYNGTAFQVPGGAAGGTVTLEVIAYNANAGGYAGANYRGHSAPFTLTMQSGTAVPPTANVGPAFQTFQVAPVPEPSIFALSGLGAAALMLIRRKK